MERASIFPKKLKNNSSHSFSTPLPANFAVTTAST